MKVDVRDILKSNGESLDIEFDNKIEELNVTDSEISFDKPVYFKGNVLNISGVLKLEGDLKAEYEAKCIRCLKDIKRTLNIKIKEDIQSADTVDETEAYTYFDNHFDLGKILTDNIILNIPMKDLCREDCKGLCPVCGADMNIADCGCSVDNFDPRMEALKDFFK
jgi:uncharacterized protein